MQTFPIEKKTSQTLVYFKTPVSFKLLETFDIFEKEVLLFIDYDI